MLDVSEGSLGEVTEKGDHEHYSAALGLVLVARIKLAAASIR